MPEINRGIDRTDEDNTLYLGAARNIAHRVHPDLKLVTAELDDNTLGGLARTLIGLIADGADPRQELAIELIDETSDDQGQIIRSWTTEFTVEGDGTSPTEYITLSFKDDTLTP